jgi:hypothetical protein
LSKEVDILNFSEVVFTLDKKLNSNEKNKRYEVKILKVNDEINHLGLVLSVPKEENELDFKHFYKAEIYLNKVKANAQDFGFDYQKYLGRKQIYFQGYAPNSFQVAEKENLTLSEKIKQKRLEVLQNIDQAKLSEKSKEFTKGIILADRTEMDRETVEDFSKSGLVHILAISGSHMAIIFWLILLLLKPIFPANFRNFPIVISLIFIWLFAIFIDFGSCAIIVQGFEWKLSSASTWTTITTTINGNAITHNLLVLAPNTAYQFRAYATTNSGTVYGTTQNFTTLAIVPPTVVTTPATALAYTTATLNGTITLGSEVVLSQGFEWALSSSNTWNVTIDNLIANALTHNLTLLAPNTAYKYRAYATTASGTVYGTTQNFTTLAIVPPTVVTNAATLVTENSSTLNGTITAATETITSKGFEWKVASSNTK